MEDKHIEKNVYLVYSPDEGVYFFDDRTPGNWGESLMEYTSEKSALEAWANETVNFSREE
jgi:hypothetical protein